MQKISVNKFQTGICFTNMQNNDILGLLIVFYRFTDIFLEERKICYG